MLLNLCGIQSPEQAPHHMKAVYSTSVFRHNDTLMLFDNMRMLCIFAPRLHSQYASHADKKIRLEPCIDICRDS